jgi:Fungal specific transcription factor domain
MEEIPSAMLACLFAHNMIFWKQTMQQLGKHCPDVRFVCNQATEALYSELHLSPGISTVTAILLNVSGRPVTSMIGNGVLLGAAISMAHSLGLNHDPINWDIPVEDKILRMRVWWVIYTLDKWYVYKYDIANIKKFLTD